MAIKEEFSAGIVLYNNGRYLLLNYGRSWRAKNRWGFTKGHIERSETVREAALREAFEETGIKGIKILNDFEHKVVYYFNRGNQRIKKTVIYLIGLTDETKVHISSEHFGFYWATYEEALRMLTFENTKRVIKAAEKFLKERGIIETKTETKTETKSKPKPKPKSKTKTKTKTKSTKSISKVDKSGTNGKRSNTN